jgi:hypothetical protein
VRPTNLPDATGTFVGLTNTTTREQLALPVRGRPRTATDETVATGAALQAAAVIDGGDFGAVTARWQLGVGERIEPRHEAASVRTRYRSASARRTN